MRGFVLLAFALAASPAWGEHLATSTFTKSRNNWGFAGKGLQFGETFIGVNDWMQVVTMDDVGESWPVPLDWHSLVHDGQQTVTYRLGDLYHWSYTLKDMMTGPLVPPITFSWLAAGVPADYRLTSAELTLTSLSISAIPMEPSDEWLSGSLRLDFYGDAIPPTPGDFNQNGEVDAADYVLWRTRFTPPVGPAGDLPNESGQTAGFLAEEDYHFWRSQFGRDDLPVGAALGSASIPEPRGLVLFVIGLTLIHWRKR